MEIAALSVFEIVSLCSPGWPQTHGPVLASSVLGSEIQVGTISCGSCCSEGTATAELRAPNTAWQAAIAHVETDIPRDVCIISFGGLDRTYVP